MSAAPNNRTGYSAAVREVRVRRVDNRIHALFGQIASITRRANFATKTRPNTPNLR